MFVYPLNPYSLNELILFSDLVLFSFPILSEASSKNSLKRSPLPESQEVSQGSPLKLNVLFFV